MAPHYRCSLRGRPTGRTPGDWPVLGWGIAVFVHALSVFLPFRGWEERKARQLYEREQRRQLGQR